MSDPKPQREDEPTVDATPGKGVHPLLWLLVLAALLAFGWSLYNYFAGKATPAMIHPDAVPAAVPAK